MLGFAIAILQGALWLDAGCRWTHAPRQAAAARLLAGAIAGASALLLWLLTLGALGLIGPWPIWLGAALFWASSRRRAPAPLPGLARRALVLLRPRRGARLRALGAWLVLALCAAALVRGLARPEPEYDAISYHLPYTAAVLDHGSIPQLDTPFGDCAQAYQPKNDALLRTALVAHDGDERLLWLGAFGHLPLCLLAVYAGARALRCRRHAALLGAATVAVGPIVIQQAAGAMVDLALASWWMAFAALCLHRRALPAGLALGLAYGTKYLAVPFTPLAALIALAGLGLCVKAWARLALGVLLTGSCFYARNAWLTGNPLYPIETLGFPGCYGGEAMRAWVFNLSQDPALSFWEKASALTVPLAGVASLGQDLTWRLALPLAIPLLLWGLGVAASLRSPRALALLALAPAVLALCWWQIPFTYGRFAILALGALGVAAACVAQRHALPVALALAVQLVLCWQVQAEALAALGVAGLVVGVSALRRGRPSRLLPHVLVLPLLAGLLAIAARPAGPPWERCVPDWQTRWAPALAALREARVVAYAGHNLPYALRGLARRQVVHVPTDGRLELRFHDRAAEWRRLRLAVVCPEPGLDRRIQDPAAWLGALRRSGAQALVVTTLTDQQLLQVRHDQDGFPIEAAWAQAMAPALELAHEGPGVRVFRLDPRAAPGQMPAAVEQREPDAFALLGDPAALARHYPRGAAEIVKPRYARMRARAGG